jgi:hypothetical protein
MPTTKVRLVLQMTESGIQSHLTRTPRHYQRDEVRLSKVRHQGAYLRKAEFPKLVFSLHAYLAHLQAVYNPPTGVDTSSFHLAFPLQDPSSIEYLKYRAPHHVMFSSMASVHPFVAFALLLSYCI